MEHKLDEPCVHIYAAMGLYGESVDLALKVSTACLLACVLNCHGSLWGECGPCSQGNYCLPACMCAELRGFNFCTL